MKTITYTLSDMQLSLFLLIFLKNVCVCVCVYVHATTQTWRSEDTLKNWVLSFHQVDPGIELRPSARQQVFSHSKPSCQPSITTTTTIIII